MNKYLNILARALVAAIFLFSGLGKLIGFNETVAMAASEGLPLPTVSIAAAALIEIGAGLALLVGWQVRWASLALIAFLIPATLVFHAAHIGDPSQSRMQTVEVMKNMAIIGGLLKFYLGASSELRDGVARSSG